MSTSEKTPEKIDADAQTPIPIGRRASIAVRSAIFNIAFYLNMILLMVGCLPMAFLGRRSATLMAHIWGKSSLWLLKVICGVKVEYRGLENIPEGGVVIASKHQSFLETFAIALLFPDFAFVLKRELTWIPLFGWFLKGVDQIAIDRSSGKTALAQVSEGATRFLREKRVIVLFPEGTRRTVGAPPSYKYGVSYLYETLGAPILPAALNTGLFWPRRSFLRKPGTAVIEFLPLIPPGLDRIAFSETLENVIESKSAALVDEALQKDPSLASAIYRPSEASN